MWIVPSGALFFLTRQSALDPFILEMLFNFLELKFRNGMVRLNFLEETYPSQMPTKQTAAALRKKAAWACCCEPGRLKYIMLLIKDCEVWSKGVKGNGYGGYHVYEKAHRGEMEITTACVRGGRGGRIV